MIVVNIPGDYRPVLGVVENLLSAAHHKKGTSNNQLHAINLNAENFPPIHVVDSQSASRPFFFNYRRLLVATSKINDEFDGT